MAKTKYVGSRYVDYENKAGRNVKGYSLYFTEEGRKGVEGTACFDSWVSVETYLNYFSCVSYGSNVELSYNRYGNITGCSVIFD